MTMKLLTVIGARPQFIKAAVVSRAIREHAGLREVILHTGQHFDANMSDIFFEQLDIPRPDHLLNIHSGTHGNMTGRMLLGIERVLLQEKPDRVLVYGDTNSTLAGALAAAKLHIPVAHVEAGLRSFRMKMPEEINRIVADQLSDLLFCPTETAVRNLEQEGFTHKPAQVLQVGDVMQDAALLFAAHATAPNLPKGMQEFVLATLHRAENTDSPERLRGIVKALNQIHRDIMPVILPLHPRTKAALASCDTALRVHVIEPVGYLHMLGFLQRCALVLTDSGGLQKEAFFFQKPCVTLRDETEWMELVEHGVNRLAGAETERIVASVREMQDVTVADPDCLYGGGTAVKQIVLALGRGV